MGYFVNEGANIGKISRILKIMIEYVSFETLVIPIFLKPSFFHYFEQRYNKFPH
ncbi:MAG: hypothetical protein ACI9XO_001704 [Paraglaciecola sp.]|jgi:hypothetical protein